MKVLSDDEGTNVCPSWGSLENVSKALLKAYCLRHTWSLQKTLPALEMKALPSGRLEDLISEYSHLEHQGW